MFQIICVITVAVMLMAGPGLIEMNSEPKRDINLVLRAHDKELLSIPNVVGVYVGVMEKTGRPCLKVMVTHQWSKASSPIPSSIEGYPVIIEVTGEIRPVGER